MQQEQPSLVMTDPFLEHYNTTKRLMWGMGIILLAVVIAGFWNFHLVDGFGRDFIAGRIPLGFGVNRGMGAVEVTNIKITPFEIGADDPLTYLIKVGVDQGNRKLTGLDGDLVEALNLAWKDWIVSPCPNEQQPKGDEG